jgi:hypothetical protein
MRLIKFEEGSGYCGKCLKQAPVYRARIRHTPYIILTLFTLGFGAIIWIHDARKKHQWKCMDCSADVYKIMN